jgi:hypothetical protein
MGRVDFEVGVGEVFLLFSVRSVAVMVEESRQ